MAQKPETNPNPFAQLPPKNTLKLHSFKAHVPQRDIDRLKRKLDDVEEIKTTWENSFAPEEMELGLRKGWVEDMLGEWRNEYDWRETEAEINSLPNFSTHITVGEHSHTVHFAALFSQKQDAVPVIMTHGWPGSFLEFLPLMKLLTSKFTPQTLPIHLVCPSLIGFGFSSSPPRHTRFTNLHVCQIWDAIMKGLGFGDGYVAQGGDIGSYVSRVLGEKFEACKAIHLNMFRLRNPPSHPELDAYRATADAYDQACVDRWKYFIDYEFAYRNEHATKPGTIAMVVESSPVALLAWIGEKFLRWSDTNPTSRQILDDVTLYYLTHTFATSLYHYWNAPPSANVDEASQPDSKVLQEKQTPVGYSLFAKEIVPVPVEFVRKECNLVWSKQHDKGGHFAALEQPELLVDDLLDFIKVAWKP